jgi:hypothetical protein
MRCVNGVMQMCSHEIGLRLAVLTILAWGTTTVPSMAHSGPATNQEEVIAVGGIATDDVGVELSASKPPPEDIFHDGFEPGGPSPANDTCQTATSLQAGTPVTGTTVGASSNYDSGLETATCTGFMQPGPDVAYKITLVAGQAITVTLSAPYATFDPSISLLGPGTASSTCDIVPVNCLAGADAAGFGAGESFMYTTVATGTYYIIVDSYYGPASSGAFTLNVTSP